MNNDDIVPSSYMTSFVWTRMEFICTVHSYNNERSRI